MHISKVARALMLISALAFTGAPAIAQERTHAAERVSAGIGHGAPLSDDAHAHGKYVYVLRDKNGQVKWTGESANVVTTVGRNLALDTFLAGSSYTVTGPYIGLISSVSYSAVSASDTMASHSGWLEAGSTNAPTFSARIICAWSGASGASKSLSAGLVFTFTGSGTVQGVFLVYGSGAVSTLGNTSGTLYSASALGTPRAVLSGDTLTVSYAASM